MSAAVWPPISHEQLIKEEEDSLVSLSTSSPQNLCWKIPPMLRFTPGM